RRQPDDSPAQQHELVGVAREPPEYPEQARVNAAVEAVRNERDGLRALHAPGVEVLVARKREEALILTRHAAVAGLRQVVAAEDQARRGAMLEPAPGVAADGEAQEPVAVERRRAAEELDLRLADQLQVGRDAHDPRAALDLLHGQRLTRGRRLDPDDEARELAQQITARDPRREREALLGGGVVDSAFDLEQVPVEIGEANAIADQGRSPRDRSGRRALSHNAERPRASGDV